MGKPFRTGKSVDSEVGSRWSFCNVNVHKKYYTRTIPYQPKLHARRYEYQTIYSTVDIMYIYKHYSVLFNPSHMFAQDQWPVS